MNRWQLAREFVKPDKNAPPGRRWDHMFPLVKPREMTVLYLLMTPLFCFWADRHDCEVLFIVMWPLAAAVAYLRGVWPFKDRIRKIIRRASDS